MVTVRLKGVHKVRAKLASGQRATYYYAWRGGPRLKGEPGDAEFIASYQAALDSRFAAPPGTMAALLADYKRSGEFKALADKTRKEYLGYLDMIGERFGAASLDAMGDKRMRRQIKAWRDGMASTPRKADLAVAVLRRVLSYGVDQADLVANVASGLKRLHSADRANLIWEPGEIEAFCRHASKPLQRAMHLARLTGLRRSDLVRLPWSAFKGDHFDYMASKSRKRVIIPAANETAALLASMPRRGPIILTGGKGRPWTPDGLSTVEKRAREKAGIAKHWHDLKGNFVTHLCKRGFSDEEIADIVGWRTEDVAYIRRIYADRDGVLMAAISRLNGNTK